jgi:tetratricopeptide repeat protein 21B
MYECNTLEHTVVNPRNAAICDLITRGLEFAPGSIPFSYFLAVLAFGDGKYGQAIKAIQKVLLSHWGFNASHCHLLLAQIRLYMKQFDDAEAALARAVSYEFGIRSTLCYRVISAELSEARGQYDKAIETLIGVRKITDYVKSTHNEKVNLTLLMARCYHKQHKFEKTLQVLTDGITEWASTGENDRILLFQASVLADSGRIRDGIEILEHFPPTNPHYAKAQRKAAKIYLRKLNDKIAYIRCFRQLVKALPNKANYVLLGDAYQHVNRFQESIECFFSAFQSNPNDKDISIRLARSLFTVHNYTAALSAYTQAISASNNDLHAQLEYCRALVTLCRLDDA